jgi:predicted nucleic acid-binding Zn ribbon protein
MSTGRRRDVSTAMVDVNPRGGRGGLAHLGSVRGDTFLLPWRHPVATPPARCADAHLGCSCRGDRSIHEERSKERTEARAHASESVECPECGAATSPLNIVTWGHCRSCRTAQSREMYPLRW